MKADALMDAFQYLDEDIIESVDLIRRNPVSAKKGWHKWLATAACICLILTAIRLMPAGFIGFGGGSDGAVAEDMDLTNSEIADGKEEEQSQLILTLPDYDSITRGNIQMNSYANSENTLEHKDTDKKDSTTQQMDDALNCTTDVLPVYCNLNIPTSIFVWDDLGLFEQQLKKMTSYEIYEQYPCIDKDEAAILLDKGHYLTLTSSEYYLEKDYQTELVYLYDKESDLAIPYYRFYNQTGDIKEKSYSGYFVPAISQEYITNMPAN